MQPTSVDHHQTTPESSTDPNPPITNPANVPPNASESPPASSSATTTHPTNGVNLMLFTVDLRLHDNPALCHAIKHATNLLPVYCFDTRYFRTNHPFARFRNHFRVWPTFVIDAIWELRIALQSKGSNLIIRVGHTDEIISQLCATYNVQSVFLIRKTHPGSLCRNLRTALARNGIRMRTVCGNSLYERKDLPPSVLKISSHGTRTLYISKLKFTTVRNPLPVPSIPPLPNASISPGEIPALPALGFDETYVNSTTLLELREMVGGETEALHRLSSHINQLSQSSANESANDRELSLQLVAWLQIGCISPRKIFHELRNVRSLEDVRMSNTYMQLVWSDAFMLLEVDILRCKSYSHIQRKRSMSGKRVVDSGPYRAFQRS